MQLLSIHHTTFLPSINPFILPLISPYLPKILRCLYPMRLYNITRCITSMLRQAQTHAFSRSRNPIPTYLASNYSRNSGISASKGAFSYSNIKAPYNGNTSINKDIKYIKNNNYPYSQNYKDGGNNLKEKGSYEREREEERRERERSEFRIKEGRKEEGVMGRSDPYNGRTYTPSAGTESKQSIENAYSYTNVRNDQKNNTATGGRSKTVGLVGLNNIGNTCFMNSILQCMLNLPHFNDYFLENRHLKETSSQGRVAQAYGRLVQLIRSSTARAETPSEIKNAVALKKPRFSGYAQQDAQEFLAALLELLSLDLNRSKNPKYKQLTADLSKRSLQQISEDWWNYNRQRQNSVVCDFFTGQLLSKVICCTCRNQSIAFDNTWDFALNFSHSDNGDLSRMLENFLKEQTISSDYYCSKCKTFRECKRKLDFYRLPNILVLQIKRFSFGKYSKQKLNNRLKVSEELDLGGLVTVSKHSSTRNPTYRLVGVVNHSGDINFGHYTADCKNPITQRWYNFNDSSVSETRMSSSFQSSAPYLLFYAKNQ